MEIGPANALVSMSYSAVSAGQQRNKSAAPPTVADASTSVQISDEAKASALAADAKAAQASTGESKSEIDARLAAIKKKDAVHRTPEDVEYLHANDKELAGIVSKPPNTRTAEDLDYMQKAGGFMNSMSMLSPEEKALYNKAVASGNQEARSALALIAMTRYGSTMAGGKDGEIYNPQTTEITPENVEKYFRHSIVTKDPSIKTAFDALIAFLKANPPEVAEAGKAGKVEKSAG